MKILFALVVRLMTAAALTLSFPALADQTSKEIYDRIVAIDKKTDADSAVALRKGDVGGAMFGFTESFSESIDLQKKLKQMALGGNAEAAFYWGLYKFDRGARFQPLIARQTDRGLADGLRNTVNQDFADAMTGLTIASKSGNPDASWNIALLYENGFGVSQSKLAAAEWYAKAGAQYLKRGYREVALAALERAEAIDAKIPDAVRLRALLYPQGKK